MGKVLIAAFDDKEETTFDELLSFLKSKSHIKVLNTFPNDSCLRYDNLVINAKYRMVERNGETADPHLSPGFFIIILPNNFSASWQYTGNTETESSVHQTTLSVLQSKCRYIPNWFLKV